MKKLIFLFVAAVILIAGESNAQDHNKIKIFSRKEIRKISRLIHSGIPTKTSDSVSINFYVQRLFWFKPIYKYVFIIDEKKVLVSETPNGQIWVENPDQIILIIGKNGCLVTAAGVSGYERTVLIPKTNHEGSNNSEAVEKIKLEIISSFVKIGRQALTLID